MASIIEDHPQRIQIDRAILAGQSARAISRWANPYVSHTAVNLYRSSILKYAVARKAKDVATKAIQAVTKETGVNQSAASDAVTRAALLQPFLERMEKKYTRYDKLLDPKVLQDLDPRAVAALDTAETRAMDLHAKLAGVIDSGTSQATTNIMLVLPRGNEAQERPPALGQPYIDVEPVE